LTGDRPHVGTSPICHTACNHCFAVPRGNPSDWSLGTRSGGTIVPRSLLYVIKLQQALLVESLDISGEFSIRGFDCLLNFAVKPGVALQQVQQGITEVIDELAFRLASSVSEKDLQSNLDKYEVRFGSIWFDLLRFGRIRVGLGVPHLNQMERLDTIGTQNWMPARWPNWNVNSNFRTEGGFIC